MTKKDYIKIAELLRKYSHDNIPLIMGFTEILQEDNPRFDKRLFMDACKMKNDKLEKEVWYICDHASSCTNSGCLDGKHPISNKMEWFALKLLKPNKCPTIREDVKLIPC